MTVLDASALLAFLFRETGHEQVAAALDSACLSTVNLSEVLGRFARDDVVERDLDRTGSRHQIGQRRGDRVDRIPIDR